MRQNGIRDAIVGRVVNGSGDRGCAEQAFLVVGLLLAVFGDERRNGRRSGVLQRIVLLRDLIRLLVIIKAVSLDAD